jgi:hypothetical protein
VVNPEITLVKLEDPLPLFVFELDVVGVPVVFQHTPFSVILVPPSDKLVPPDFAVVSVIELGETVVIVGIVGESVVIIFSNP